MKKVITTILAITLLALPLSANAVTFSDIDESSPYYLAVTYLSEKNIISGYPDGSFQPFNNINRAELLKIVMEGKGTEITNPQTNCFSDVPYSEWYAQYICTAKILGYINGYEDGTFKPEQNINKVEAIKIIGEVYEWDLNESSDAEIFTDTPEIQWYAPYLKYAKSKNFLPESGGKYNPSNHITRGSISETIFRMLATIETESEKYSSSVKEKIVSSLYIEINEETQETTEISTSSISGITTDATTGLNLQDVDIALYDNEDNFSNNTQSNQEGIFELSAQITSTDYVIFSKEGYFTFQIPITEIVSGIHVALSREFTQIAPEELRIVLTWGDSESDFDAHLFIPNGEEIFFMHRISTNIDTILDIDSTEPNGTETITINSLQEGTYEYFIHHYSGEDAFAESNARVEVYDENGLAKIFYPPINKGEIWHLFTLNENGEITDLNEVGDCDLLETYTSVCPIEES